MCTRILSFASLVSLHVAYESVISATMIFFFQQLKVAIHLVFLIGCIQLLSSARCIPGSQYCDDTLQRVNYLEHMNVSETLLINNVSVNLREAQGYTDRLGEFNLARVCPWHYEADYNSSRFPQVIYTAHCDTETWCDNDGETFKCLPLDEYRVPIVIGQECDLFTNTEWTLTFVNVAVSCYPSSIQMDTEEVCSH